MCFLVIIWVMAKIIWEIKRNWVGQQQQQCHRTDNEPGDDDRRRRQRDSVLSGVSAVVTTTTTTVRNTPVIERGKKSLLTFRDLRLTLGLNRTDRQVYFVYTSPLLVTRVRSSIMPSAFQ